MKISFDMSGPEKNYNKPEWKNEMSGWQSECETAASDETRPWSDRELYCRLLLR